MKCVSADVVDLLMLSLWPNNLHFNFSYTPKEATTGLNAPLCGLSALYHGYIECIHSPKKNEKNETRAFDEDFSFMHNVLNVQTLTY